MTYSVTTQGKTPIVAGLKVCDLLRLSNYTLPIDPVTGTIDYTSKKRRPLTENEKAALDQVTIDDKLIKILTAIQQEYPDYELGITDHGGHRRSATVDGQLIDLNKAVGGADGSQHKYGRGADIYLRHKQNGGYLDTAVFAVAAERIMNRIGVRGGVGIYSKQHNYIHVDCRGSWSAWFETYNGNGLGSQGGRPVVFRNGNKAAGIKLIQRALYAKGYTECGTTDGKYGAKTEAAVKRFQTDNGLTADGIYGKDTNKILGALPW